MIGFQKMGKLKTISHKRLYWHLACIIGFANRTIQN